jgi:hypothetical protein
MPPAGPEALSGQQVAQHGDAQKRVRLFLLRCRSGFSSSLVIAIFGDMIDERAIRRRRMAMWNQSRNGAAVTPASSRIERSVGGVADGGEVSPDQRFNCGVGPGDSGESLPGSIGRFDAAETRFKMSLALLTAADIGRPQLIRRRQFIDGHPHLSVAVS